MFLSFQRIMSGEVVDKPVLQVLVSTLHVLAYISIIDIYIKNQMCVGEGVQKILNTSAQYTCTSCTVLYTNFLNVCKYRKIY